MAWRSVLFVPGNRPDLAAKATRSRPDVVVVDLEDAVPRAEKVAARATAREAAEALAGTTNVCIRVNPPGTNWFDGDMDCLPDSLTAVVVPKWEAHYDLGRPVLAGLETVRGVADARLLLGSGVVACYFGAEDYAVDLGGVRTESNIEVLYARSSVAIAARLAGVPALDMITADFGDSERFVREAELARALGYAGKLCIHPGQVDLANNAFAPSAAEIDRARRLLDAYEAGGRVTMAFEGQMVDEVIARQAQTMLDNERSVL